jgi:hypothetical protein
MELTMTDTIEAALAMGAFRPTSQVLPAEGTPGSQP